MTAMMTMPMMQPQAPAPDSTQDAPSLTASEHAAWKRRIERAKQHHEPWWKAADEIEREYLGPTDAAARDAAIPLDVKGFPVNLIASFINTVGREVLPANPWPIVSQRKPGKEYDMGAKRLSARERQVFDSPRTMQQLRRAMFDAFCMCGFVLTAWEPRGSRIVAGRAKAKDGEGAEADSTAPVNTAAATRPGQADLPYDQPQIHWIPRKDIRIDPDVRAFSDATWVGYRMDKRLTELQAGQEQGIYHDVEQVKARGHTAETGSDSEPPDADKVADVYVIFHHGRQPGEIGVLTLAGDQFTEIRHVYTKTGAEGFPIRQLVFHEANRLLGANPIQAWHDLSLAFNEFLAEATEAAALAKTITIVPDKETQDSITKAAGSTVIVCADRKQVGTEKIGGTTPDTWQAIETFERIVDKVSGISDFRRGQQMKGDPTATEIQAIMTFAQGQAGDYQDVANSFLRCIAADMGGMLLEHQWQEVPVKLDLGAGRNEWDTFSSDNTPGGLEAYDFDFDVSQQSRITPAIKQKRASERLEILANLALQQMAAAEGYQFSVVEGLRDLLDASGERDIDRYLIRIPTPQERAAQQQQHAIQENQAMEAGMPATVDYQGDDHRVHIQIHNQSDSPAAAEHAAEHYAAMAQAMQQPQRAQPGAATSPGPQPKVTGRGSVGVSEAGMAGQAASVA
jgi:hypothetical protein